MASFTSKPVEGQDPWAATDLAWRASVETAVNAVEGTANAAATKAYADGIKTTADAALPSASFDTRLGTRVKVDNTVGRTASVWDASNSRWQLIYGDTGWRDITNLLINGWTATAIYMKRDTYEVTFVVEGLNASAMTDIAFIAPPFGFVPQVLPNTSPRALLETLTSPAVSWRVSHTGGNLVLAGATTSLAPLSGVLRFKTVHAWPTSLPGTAFGAIPNA